MSVYRVLDKLEGYVHEGTWLPAGYRILSEERLVELIEKIRSSLPEEVGRAKIIAQDKDRMMKAAQDKAQAIVSEATEKYEELVDQHEIVQRARAASERILAEAEDRSKRLRDDADKYALDLLTSLENRLSAASASVRKGREALSARPQQTQALAEAAAKSKRAAFDAQASDETAALESIVSPS